MHIAIRPQRIALTFPVELLVFLATKLLTASRHDLHE